MRPDSRRAGRILADLLVAPLNGIHGRVFCDWNANNPYDAGEGVAGAVLHLDKDVTATDRNGFYSFYNLPPGRYVVRLNAEKLPPGFETAGVTDLVIDVGDLQSVTGTDFLVRVKTKPIIWREAGR